MSKVKEQVTIVDNYAKSVLEYDFDPVNVIKSDIIRDLKIKTINIVFSACLFVLISHHFKLLTERRTN